MTEQYSGSTEAITHQQLDRAIGSSILATYRVAGIESRCFYDINYTDDEKFCDFPAKLSFKNNGDTALNVHKRSLDEYAEDITGLHPDITADDIAKLYVAGAVIPHMFIAHVAPRKHDVAALDKLYGHMASADSLCEGIADSLLDIGFNEELLRLSVLSRSEDDIAKINRMRLAVGIMIFDYDDAGLEPTADRQSTSFSARLGETFNNYLMNIKEEIERYAVIARQFGMDEHSAQKQYLDSISPLEIAAAFPMSLGEVSTIARLVADEK